MAWTLAEKIGAYAVGAVVAGAIWFGSSGDAQAARVTLVDRRTPPTGTSELQPVPFPTPQEFTRLPASDHAAIIRTVQFQLNSLGYGPLQVDGNPGGNNSQTSQAIRGYIAANRMPDVPPTGNNELDDAAGAIAVFLAIDANYRALFNLPNRLATSSGLYGRAARRSARVREY